MNYISLNNTGQIEYKGRQYSLSYSDAGTVDCHLIGGGFFDKIVEIFYKWFGRPDEILQEINKWGADHQNAQFLLNFELDHYHDLMNRVNGCKVVERSDFFDRIIDYIYSTLQDPDLQKAHNLGDERLTSITYSLNLLGQYLTDIGIASTHRENRMAMIQRSVMSNPPNIILSSLVTYDKITPQQYVDSCWEQNFQGRGLHSGFNSAIDGFGGLMLEAYLRDNDNSLMDFYCTEISGGPNTETGKCINSLRFERDSDLTNKLMESSASVCNTILDIRSSPEDMDNAYNSHLENIKEINEIIKIRNDPSHNVTQSPASLVTRLVMSRGRDQDLYAAVVTAFEAVSNAIHDPKNTLISYEEAKSKYDSAVNDGITISQSRNLDEQLKMEVAKLTVSVADWFSVLASKDNALPLRKKTNITAIWDAVYNERTNCKIPTTLNQKSVDNFVKIGAMLKKLNIFNPDSKGDTSLAQSNLNVLHEHVNTINELLTQIDFNRDPKSPGQNISKVVIINSVETILSDESIKRINAKMNEMLQLI